MSDPGFYCYHSFTATLITKSLFLPKRYSSAGCMLMASSTVGAIGTVRIG